MRIRPCIDIHDGKVKQIVGGSLRDRTEAEGGPAAPAADLAVENFVSERAADWFAALYREKGLSGGHIIMLNARREQAYQADRVQALKALAAFPGGMQIGGGLTPEDAPDYIRAGASHVIVTSYVFRDGQIAMDRLEQMLAAVGRKHLVLDLSCRRTEDGSYRVVTDRWQKFTDYTVSRENLSFLSAYCDEFLIHAADVEGKRGGIEEDLVRLLGEWQARTDFPVTYAGGVHSVEDLRLSARLTGGRLDLTVGSALDLFGGNLRLDDLVAACEQK